MRGASLTRTRPPVGEPWNPLATWITSLTCRDPYRDMTSLMRLWLRHLSHLWALETFSALNVSFSLFTNYIVDKNSSSNLMRVGSAAVLDSNHDGNNRSRRHKKTSSQNLSMSSKEPSSSSKAGASTFNNPARKTSLFGNMKRKQT